MAQSKRSFVDKLDFVTSLGHGKGGDDRRRHGVSTKGPTKVITDLCVMEPDPQTKELTVTTLHPGVTPGAGRCGDGLAAEVCREEARGDQRADRDGAEGAAGTAPPHR